MGIAPNKVTASSWIRSHLLFSKVFVCSMQDWCNNLDAFRYTLPHHTQHPLCTDFQHVYNQNSRSKAFFPKQTIAFLLVTGELGTDTQAMAPSPQTADIMFDLSGLNLRVATPAPTSWTLLGLISLHYKTSSAASFRPVHLVLRNPEHRISDLMSSF